MFQVYLSAYPWDLADDNVDRVLDRLRGEIGVTGLSVWMGVPAVSPLRVRDVKPRVFRTRGGLFFQPDSERYTSTRCKPIVSEWLKTRRPLAHLSEACQKRGMTLRAIVSASMTGRLVQRHPEMACKNAFGDGSQLSLCLANPDVQAYLCHLVSDLSQRDGVFGVTIADFVLSWADAWANVLELPVGIGGTELGLLSICFCESCHQGATSAGMDVDMARRSVQTMLQRTFDRGSFKDADFESILADNQPLADFCMWRSSTLSLLLGRLVDVCSGELLLDRRANGTACGCGTEPNWTLPSGVITRLDVTGQLGDALCHAAQRNELQIPGSLALEPRAPDLVRIMSQAVELGYSAVEIEDYGLLPEAALVPIKQGIRFAKRSARS